MENNKSSNENLKESIKFCLVDSILRDFQLLTSSGSVAIVYGFMGWLMSKHKINMDVLNEYLTEIVNLIIKQMIDCKDHIVAGPPIWPDFLDISEPKKNKKGDN
jgi:hypothetical protein